jgi:hypothetical protein
MATIAMELIETGEKRDVPGWRPRAEKGQPGLIGLSDFSPDFWAATSG